MAVIEREIKFFKRDKDGRYIQPDQNSPELETIMDKNRQHAAEKSQYANSKGCGNGKTYDPTGRTICGHCNMYLAETNDCTELVDIVPGKDGDINPNASSCRYFERKRAGDWEVRFKRHTKEDAEFGTAANGEGFGCGSPEKKRCGWRENGKWVDSEGLGEWCSAYFFTTEPTACCDINSTPTIEGQEDDDDDDDDTNAEEYSEGKGEMADSAPMTQYGPAKGGTQSKSTKRRPRVPRAAMGGRANTPLATETRKR